MHHPTDRITHNTAFVTPVVEHWLEREIAVLSNDALNTFLFTVTWRRTNGKGPFRERERKPDVMEHWWNEKYIIGSTMKDQSDDPSHHEPTL